MISLQDVDFSFRDRPLFRNLNLRIEKGEFVALLGPSGSGKSTLLRLMAGLLEPQKGRITAAGAKTSFVFQEPRLLSWRNLLENVRLPLEIQNRSVDSAALAISDVELTGSERLYPHELSGGMKQRASLARALATEPEVLFFDEPLSALDEPTRFSLQEKIHHLWQTKRFTSVFVTHSVSEALFMSERILVLRPDGSFYEEKTPADWIRDKTLRTHAEFAQFTGRISEVLGGRS